RDSRRFFGFSSIEHSGIAIFAFGIGGPAIIFGGLLHMLLHTLLKSALFQALTKAALARGSAAPGNYGFSHLRGMIATSKQTGWLLVICIFALTGLPPSGLFTSEYLIISETIIRDPYYSLPLGAGLLLCAIAIIRQVGPVGFAPAPASAQPQKAGADIITIYAHLILVVLLAFAMPVTLVTLLSHIAVALQ
ncbi:MAG: proton-conducting transporter membrane subunit, partial [Acidocella sp.]|nr:proton-conducting transporter membrane subunit [Acidocella sp.]